MARVDLNWAIKLMPKDLAHSDSTYRSNFVSSVLIWAANLGKLG
ncbi:hypothetical protein CCACVL1_08357 [Corchorus capsularis]|uniref:Uncharacterized protein n=1 Tax=Corchorus capsularis TaxID=210143 RepID=A0A1R3J0Z0_COCAP|nr:hypothetical protein CCACVL1_08357 [Corchorus capsularis]